MRQLKPFFRKFTNTWYVQIQGKQINLGADKKKAWAEYAKLTASPEQLIASPKQIDAQTTSVLCLFDLYLDLVQKNKSPATNYSARRYVNSFARTLPS